MNQSKKLVIIVGTMESSMSLRISNQEFNEKLKEIKKEYNIFGPKRIKNSGRFSDTDIIRYGDITCIEEIEWNEKSTFSPKEVIFPISETMFYFTEEEFKIPHEGNKKILLFLRPCDLNGILRLDNIFLRNGPQIDNYYQRLREKVVFVVIECERNFKNCFCVSMDSNIPKEYDICVKFFEDYCLIHFQKEEYREIFDFGGKSSDYVPNFIKENNIKIKNPNFEEIPEDFHNHEMWKQYDTRCIGCGRCSTTCITCSCFTSYDIFYDDNQKVGERRRTWASCLIDGFTTLAGGHEFRSSKGARIRFRALHKIYDYRNRFGANMCVGCGRCDDNCPEYISFSSCIESVSNLLE